VKWPVLVAALLTGTAAAAQTAWPDRRLSAYDVDLASTLRGGASAPDTFAPAVVETSAFDRPTATAEVLEKRLRAIPFPLTLTGKAEAVEVSNDHLTLIAPKGSDLYSPANGPAANTAPRVTFAPKGDFIFSARVARPESGKYEGGALVIFASPDRWAKLLFERLDSASHAVTSSVAEPLSDNSYHLRLAASAPAVWLKVVRVGGSIMLYASEDGDDWQILRDFPLAADLPIQVGFASQSPNGERYAANFSDVRFQSQSLKDYWQGK
jgi:uncharacterized protein